jgi:uncharacterized protein YggU (UPF0235/DUF167 family)
MPRRTRVDRRPPRRHEEEPDAAGEDAIAGGDPRWAVHAHPDGAVVAVVAVPRSGTTGIDRVEGDALRLRVAAPPVDGAANAALLRFLAEVLDVPRSRPRLVAGETARRKRVLVVGRSPAEVAARLSRRLPS